MMYLVKQTTKLNKIIQYRGLDFNSYDNKCIHTNIHKHDNKTESINSNVERTSFGEFRSQSASVNEFSSTTLNSQEIRRLHEVSGCLPAPRFYSIVDTHSVWVVMCRLLGVRGHMAFRGQSRLLTQNN